LSKNEVYRPTPIIRAPRPAVKSLPWNFHTGEVEMSEATQPRCLRLCRLHLRDRPCVKSSFGDAGALFAPTPPTSVSRPRPPSSRSAPSPPCSWSLPSPPARSSSPEPPTSTSLPRPPPQRVGLSAAHQHVVAVLAVQHRLPRLARRRVYDDHVVAGPRQHG